MTAYQLRAVNVNEEVLAQRIVHLKKRQDSTKLAAWTLLVIIFELMPSPWEHVELAWQFFNLLASFLHVFLPNKFETANGYQHKVQIF